MSKANMVSECTSKAIRRLNPDDPAYAGTMARLRRGVGKSLADAPDVWGLVIPDLPDELTDTSRDGSRETEAESAVFTALTLYALHQQGSSQSVNCQGESFGAAVGKLRRKEGDEDDKAIIRRFNAVITSSEMTELAHHVRGLIQLMKASGKSIGLDYPQFARDLYNFQFPDGRKRVILRWGQDFYRINKTEEKE